MTKDEFKAYAAKIATEVRDAPKYRPGPYYMEGLRQYDAKLADLIEKNWDHIDEIHEYLKSRAG